LLHSAAAYQLARPDLKPHRITSDTAWAGLKWCKRCLDVGKKKGTELEARMAWKWPTANCDLFFVLPFGIFNFDHHPSNHFVNVLLRGAVIFATILRGG